MAKKELDFGKLALPTKPDVVKKEEAPSAVEKAVETESAKKIIAEMKNTKFTDCSS